MENNVAMVDLFYSEGSGTTPYKVLGPVAASQAEAFIAKFNNSRAQWSLVAVTPTPCKGCGESVGLFERGYCEHCYTVRVHRGYTRAELSEAFDLVKNPEHWKLPIDKSFAREFSGAEKAVIEAAVVFYAGCTCYFHVVTLPKHGTFTRVEAVGYYAAVGA